MNKTENKIANNSNLKQLDEGKLYYSISEVCALTGLEQHVLRYWESEFTQLKPKKNRAGNRAYRLKDIKLIRYIKYLLYEEMFTIPGGKKKLSDLKPSELEGQINLLRSSLILSEISKPKKIEKSKIDAATISVSDSLNKSITNLTNAKKPEENQEHLLELRNELKNILQLLDQA